MKRQVQLHRSLVLASVTVLCCTVFCTPVALGGKIRDHAIYIPRPTDPLEQIVGATESENWVTRWSALPVLTERIGKEAVPRLKRLLKDPQVRVRAQAAHCLGMLGDKSGLEPMRSDFKDLLPGPIPADPNLLRQAAKEKSAGRSWLPEARAVARVLAELGDYRGYALAVKMACHKESLYRSEAIHILLEVAKADDKTLAAQGLDPVGILCKMAASETRNTVFLPLVVGADKLPPDRAISILEAAIHSPEQLPKYRRIALKHLTAIKAREESTP